MKQEKKKKILYNNKKYFRSGFTLMEVMMAGFIFSVIMLIVTAIMVKAASVQRGSKAIEKNLEESRFTMEYMAKTIRGSAIISCNEIDADNCASAGTISSIEIFDYSQAQCIQYYYEDRTIYMVSGTNNGDEESPSCSFSSDGVAMLDSGNRIENMNFAVTVPDEDMAGKVTVSLEVCSRYLDPENPALECPGDQGDRFIIQTSVSIRGNEEVST